MDNEREYAHRVLVRRHRRAQREAEPDRPVEIIPMGPGWARVPVPTDEECAAFSKVLARLLVKKAMAEILPSRMRGDEHERR